MIVLRFHCLKFARAFITETFGGKFQSQGPFCHKKMGFLSQKTIFPLMFQCMFKINNKVVTFMIFKICWN